MITACAGIAIAVDAGGQAYITGGTKSNDFPVTQTAYQGANYGGTNSFITELNTTGTGVVYSFTTDRSGGFGDEEIQLLRSTLPGLSLAMKAHAGHVIASGLLGTYLGEDAGRRAHSGAVQRGSVSS